MTTPVNNITNNATQRPPAAPPPNPKIQAVTFAIELAKLRAVTTKQATNANELVADAQTIATFIGAQPTSTPGFG